LRLIVLLAGLLSAACLTGCAALQSQPFSCAPAVSTNRGGDMELFDRPATTAGTGYPHC
jgi:hypothetical protein